MIRTFVDTGVLIETYHGSGPLAVPALAILNDANREFVTSEFVRLEVLPKPTSFRRPLEVAFYNAFFASATHSVAINKTLVRRALRRAEEFGLSAVDALHVAAAELASADELVTTEKPDKPLPRVTPVRVLSIHP